MFRKSNRARHKKDDSTFAVKIKGVYNEEFLVNFYLPKIQISVAPHDYFSEFPGDRIVWCLLQLNRLFTKEILV